MRYVISKMFRRDPANGDLHGVNVVLARKNGQVRKLTGKVGTPDTDGFYAIDLLGGEEVLEVTLQAGTTFHIDPL